MKKTILASLVGAVIVFIYQAMSWMVLPVHNDSMKYTPNQDSVREAVSSLLTEEGFYSIPGCPPGTSHEEQERQMKENEGKPWMFIQYHKSMSMDMTPAMITGFVLNFLSVLIIVMVINATRNFNGSFSNRFWITLAFGLFIAVQSDLGQWNWWETPFHFVKGNIIDAVLSWGLCGLWLGFYLKAPAPASASAD